METENQIILAYCQHGAATHYGIPKASQEPIQKYVKDTLNHLKKFVPQKRRSLKPNLIRLAHCYLLQVNITGIENIIKDCGYPYSDWEPLGKTIYIAGCPDN